MLALVWDQSFFWDAKEDYSFGYLVPLFVAYILYDRWPKIKSAFSADNSPQRLSPLTILAWLATLIGFLTFSLGLAIRITEGPSNPASFMMALGFAATFPSGMLMLSSPQKSLSQRFHWAGLFIFPACIWLVSAPIATFFESRIKTFLLELVARANLAVFEFFGLVIEREGNILVLPTGMVGVEDACSGIRSLTGCIFAGAFIAAAFLKTPIRKFFFMLTAAALAVLTNLARSITLSAWAYVEGCDAVRGTVHDAAGYVELAVTTILLLCLVPLFNYQLPKIAPSKEDPSK